MDLGLHHTSQSSGHRTQDQIPQAFQLIHIEAYIIFIDMVLRSEVAFKLTSDSIESLIEYYRDIHCVTQKHISIQSWKLRSCKRNFFRLFTSLCTALMYLLWRDSNWMALESYYMRRVKKSRLISLASSCKLYPRKYFLLYTGSHLPSRNYILYSIKPFPDSSTLRISRRSFGLRIINGF